MFFSLVTPFTEVSAKDYKIQKIPDPGREHSLNTSAAEGHTWWARLGSLDPAAVSRAYLEAAPGIESTGGSLADRPGKDWYPVVLPGYLTKMPGYGNETKRAWYMKVFHLPAKTEDHLALRLGQINDRDRVYINGKLFAGTGRFGAVLPQAYDRERFYELPNAELRPGPNVLLVHVEVYSPGYLGPVKGNLSLGPSVEMQKNFINAELVDALFLIMYLTVGLYFLFLFARRRRERENLLFGLFCVLFVVYLGIRTQFRFETGLAFIDIKRLEYIFLYPIFPLFYYFFRTYYKIPRTRFWKWWDRIMLLPVILSAGGVVQVLVTSDANDWWTYQSTLGQLIPWPLLGIGIFIILINRVMARERDAYYMLPAWTIILVVMLIDNLSTRGILNLPVLLRYFFCAFMLSMAGILANRFVRLNEEVEDLNQNLEKKVEQRTERLNQSLSEVRTLKEQQDGDYFLTSLLINPLGGNFSRPGRVVAELRVSQKKKFQFRHWNAEIGGDLSAVYDIKLRDREYSVFVNGDAMGKSIQGAGGALVLGTVFKSVVTRSQLSFAARNKYPEQWLRECFLELQGVFVSFDGFMLITAIIGLIDLKTGTVYYINSGHPSLVLYREERAELLEGDFNLSKIGIVGAEDELRVTILQMKPGDVILSGSDGRDDLMLGMDSNGQRIINEDEYLFVRAVEEGRGELDDIATALFGRGEQTDDFSLIRFGYMEDASAVDGGRTDGYRDLLSQGSNLWNEGDADGAAEILKQAVAMRPEEPAAFSALAKLHRRRKEYARAADYYRLYQEVRPDDTEALFDIALMLKMSGDREAALDFGERCRLRAPGHVKNLVNLADCYRLTGNEERAALLLDKAGTLEPDNESVGRLQKVMSDANDAASR